MADSEVIRENGRAKVILPQELIAEEVPQIRQALKQEIAEGADEIVFDLSETESVDSVGICLLIAACNSMSMVEGTVRLIGLSEDILKLLQGMRLADSLNAAPASGEGSNG
ncbi:MAG: STAS domain-containing protein [Syntrophorhabdaceae bacterium]|nr:STAS domain-containing protein [Syntrophorhabdaceae bacterium]